MSLHTAPYEFALRNRLPAGSRDLVNYLFTTYSLASLLEFWQTQTPNQALIKQFDLQPEAWQMALKATLIAKFSAFDPLSQFTQTQRFYLLKSACAVLGESREWQSLPQRLLKQQPPLPILSEWLRKLLLQLQSP
ncbi:MAG: hypothetical protein JXR44_08620 [Thiotrichales bacterium]|nr:hypothetical protein [Thiotrichales bacterium]